MLLNIILISTGVFQSYLLDNIRQLIKLDYDNIVIITDKKFAYKLEEFTGKINIIFTEDLPLDFDNKSKLNKSFREGFWHNTSKRLFYLYACMKKYNLTDCIHIENDVLLYKKFYKEDFGFKMWITMDEKNRCIPGIIFIPNYKFMNNLINNYNYTCNDMINMCLFYYANQKICYTFPIIKQNSLYNENNMYNKNFDTFNGIFDGAAIGQYLGGVDPRNIPGNTIGFINETCVVKYNNYIFKNITVDNKCPMISIDGMEYPIYNLHIHSKDLKLFLI